MKTQFALLSLLLSILLPTRLSGNDDPESERNCWRRNANGTCAVYRISLINLIATPKQYDGRRVAVKGYIHLEFEGSGLYLHEDDYRHTAYENAIWVNLLKSGESKECQDAYVTVFGIFRAEERGHMGLWSGSIDVDVCARL